MSTLHDELRPDQVQAMYSELAKLYGKSNKTAADTARLQLLQKTVDQYADEEIETKYRTSIWAQMRMHPWWFVAGLGAVYTGIYAISKKG